MSDKIYYPKIPVTWKILKYPDLIISFVTVGYYLDLSIWLGLFIGIFVSTILISLDVCFRVGRFKRYLVNFGVKTKIEDNDALAIMGIVPFQSEVGALFSIPETYGIKIYKDEIDRFISWDEIDSIKQNKFWGKPVLILRFSLNSEFNKLVVPWSDEVNHFIPERLNS